MKAPSLLLTRPSHDMKLEQRIAFENVFKSAGTGRLLDYQLPYPKWQFLSYFCDARAVVLHGSQNQEINIVEPRQASDIRAFSNQKAIYATTDGIWVIYFAILDRKKYTNMSLFNSCMQTRIPGNQLSEPMYFFSITNSVLLQKPWGDGMIDILPRQSFIQETPQQIQGMEVIFPHWISSTPSSPIAKIKVSPEDFPFLSQIHGHNDEKLIQLTAVDPNGFPWPEALES